MAKKLLSEAVVRRFAKLAKLPTVNENMYAEEEEDMADAEELPAEMGDEMPEEPPLPEEEPMDDMAPAEELELTDDEAMAIIELGKKLEAAMPEGAGDEELPAELDAEMPEEPVGDPGAEMPAEEPEEEIMEALRGINYVPEKKEIVEEVARRVAKRLLKAKRAEKQLQEALGKTTRQRRRRTRNKK